MAPATRSKKKIEENSYVSHSQSVLTRGAKRLAEEEENEKTEETNIEKRRRQDKKELAKGLENADVEEQENTEKELIESEEESSDNFQSETSFMDLPNDIHLIIFGFLDLPTRLNLRLNKRLDRLHFAVKATMTRIIFDITDGVSHLRARRDNRALVNSSSYIEWEKSLGRFSMNTSVSRISIYVGTVLNEQHCRIIDTLFQFNACFLEIVGVPSRRIEVSHLTLPSVLTLAKNVSHVRFEVIYPSISSNDLCVIRKTILEDSFMKSFKMSVENEMKKSFMEECFGLIIEEVSEPVSGKIYRCEDDSLELYEIDSHLLHYEGHIRTCLHNHSVLIKKFGVIEQLDEYKIQLNQLLPD